MSKLDEFRAAIKRLELAGVHPTGRAVMNESGRRFDPWSGLGGSDVKVWHQAMEAEGYIREPRGNATRWVKA